MMKNFLDTIEITNQTESGIQIGKPKIIVPKAAVSVTDSGIIIPTSLKDLIEAIEDSKNIIFLKHGKKDKRFVIKDVDTCGAI